MATGALLNLVAVDPDGGNLKVWSTDVSEPDSGVVTYTSLSPNLNNANALGVGVRQDTEGDDITVFANNSAVHVRGVALGYFTTAAMRCEPGDSPNVIGGHEINTVDPGVIGATMGGGFGNTTSAEDAV